MIHNSVKAEPHIQMCFIETHLNVWFSLDTVTCSPALMAVPVWASVGVYSTPRGLQSSYLLLWC